MCRHVRQALARRAGLLYGGRMDRPRLRINLLREEYSQEISYEDAVKHYDALNAAYGEKVDRILQVLYNEITEVIPEPKELHPREISVLADFCEVESRGFDSFTGKILYYCYIHHVKSLSEKVCDYMSDTVLEIIHGRLIE